MDFSGIVGTWDLDKLENFFCIYSKLEKKKEENAD